MGRACMSISAMALTKEGLIKSVCGVPAEVVNGCKGLATLFIRALFGVFAMVGLHRPSLTAPFLR